MVVLTLEGRECTHTGKVRDKALSHSTNLCLETKCGTSKVLKMNLDAGYGSEKLAKGEKAF